jgi:hypothetical protein
VAARPDVGMASPRGSSWWEYFGLCELSDTELKDRTALSGLTYLGVVRQEKKSQMHRYQFPPQDHAIDRAHGRRDPRTGQSAGTIVEINELNGFVDLKRGANSPVSHPTALVPLDYVESKVLSDSLFRLGSWVADHWIDSPGPFRAARDLLLRRSPSLLLDLAELVIDHRGQLTEAAKELVLSLPHSASVLPIQGPPGSGKTFTGARMIVDLVSAGYQVGIVTASHKEISHFLARWRNLNEQVKLSLCLSEGDLQLLRMSFSTRPEPGRPRRNRRFALRQGIKNILVLLHLVTIE